MGERGNGVLYSTCHQYRQVSVYSTDFLYNSIAIIIMFIIIGCYTFLQGSVLEHDQSQYHIEQPFLCLLLLRAIYMPERPSGARNA